MSYKLVVEPLAFRFFGTLAQSDRARLARCWDQLELDPHVDRVTKFDLPRPPLIYSLQYCHGFYTVYKVQGDLVIVRNADWRHRSIVV